MAEAIGEAIVAKVGELKDGQMKTVKVSEHEVLLAKVDGRFYAVGAKCTHYSAPLEKGLLHGTRLMCPWHHACFDIKGGARLEPPALDWLPSYRVWLEGENVMVSLEENPRPEPARPDFTDTRTFVIVGGGAAGEAAAETLRTNGFTGRLVMVTPEDHLPYDRPNLSKDYLQGKAPVEWLPLRDEAFYQKLGVELEHRRVKRLDPAKPSLYFEQGPALEYTCALIATGSAPRTLGVLGEDLARVFTLRSWQDAEWIIAKAAQSRQAVVIGASFIGMEVAASLRKRGLEVTVVAPETVPFEKVLGERVGRMIQQLHQEHGVQFRLTERVKALKGNHRVEAVQLESGEVLPAELVIVGVGVKPVTNYLENLPLAQDGSVLVDEYLQAAPGLFAAGDIARFPDPQTGQPIRIEHWRLAQQHGQVAALNMLGQHTPFERVPFFWTAQFGLSLRYVGHAETFEQVIYWGEPEQKKFLALYVQENLVAAVAGLGRDLEMDVVEELFRLKKMPPASHLGKEIDLKAVLLR